MNGSRHDAAIIGAGIAGLAAGILLRRAGMRVVCVDARPYPHRKVGESLDWSTPGLLRRLGLDTNALLADGIATRKAKIAVREIGKAEWRATPPPVIRRAPLRFETITLHVDRTALDARVCEHASALGIDFIWERVAKVQADGRRVRSIATANGQVIDARWYIDASGTSRVLSRALGIPTVAYGRPKVCLWTCLDTPPRGDATTFFVDNGDAYLGWVWDIPITPDRTSVGFVAPADTVRDRRRAGASLDAILRSELQRHARFADLLDIHASLAVESTSFQPYVTTTVCGDNWLMVGEAAAMPDPLTGNGVTSGLRHARHAVDTIVACDAAGQLSDMRRRRYTQHVARLGHSFNAHIEHAIYRAPVRQAFGLRAATYIYTLFAFFMNSLHARFEPRGWFGMGIFGVLFLAARSWIGAWDVAGRAVLWGRRTLPGER